jgi:hypothetical protein
LVHHTPSWFMVSICVKNMFVIFPLSKWPETPTQGTTATTSVTASLGRPQGPQGPQGRPGFCPLRRASNNGDMLREFIYVFIYTVSHRIHVYIYGNIYHQYTPNVSIYTIHGSYGISIFMMMSEVLTDQRQNWAQESSKGNFAGEVVTSSAASRHSSLTFEKLPRPNPGSVLQSLPVLLWSFFMEETWRNDHQIERKP